MVEPFQYHGLLNRHSQCCFREQELVDPLGRRLELSLSSLEREEFRSSGASNTLRAHKIQGKHLNRFLRKDWTFFFFEMVYLWVALSVVNCVRMVRVTAPLHAKNILLETLLGCASGPCLHVETHVVRTAATLRTTAFASVARRNR